MQNQVFCRFCGRVMPADSQFCPHCGKSQGGPVEAAALAMEAPAAPGQPSLLSSLGAKKSTLIPILLTAIAGVFVLCCVGLLLYQVITRERLSSAATEIAVTSTTSAVQQQTDPSKKWTPAFLILYAVEQHYAETITKFERLAAGTLTRETYVNQLAIPDAYEVLFIGFYRSDELDLDLSAETAMDFAAVKPLIAGLEDDYENITIVEMEWMIEKIDEAEALSRLRQGQQVLLAERDKMYQAAKMDGMTDKTYAAIQTYLEEQWPAIKAKFDALGIRSMTPQP